MFKKFLLALVVALPFCAFAQAPKFGVVDVEGIIPKMAEFVEAQNKIGEASKTFESEYAKINEELQKKYAEFQELEKDPSTLQSIKERRIQDIQELDKKAQQFAQTAQHCRTSGTPDQDPAVPSDSITGSPASAGTADAAHPGKGYERH